MCTVAGGITIWRATTYERNKNTRKNMEKTYKLYKIFVEYCSTFHLIQNGIYGLQT